MSGISPAVRPASGKVDSTTVSYRKKCLAENVTLHDKMLHLSIYNHVQISKIKKSEMSYCINFMPGSGTKNSGKVDAHKSHSTTKLKTMRKRNLIDLTRDSSDSDGGSNGNEIGRAHV